VLRHAELLFEEPEPFEPDPEPEPEVELVEFVWNRREFIFKGFSWSLFSLELRQNHV
jgi:hypothetical protein